MKVAVSCLEANRSFVVGRLAMASNFVAEANKAAEAWCTAVMAAVVAP